MEPLIHPSLSQRKIIHFDMDAFYASIEIRDNPALAGQPVVVGGPPNSRAVVCTASYEARKFGIRSAMPCSKAFRLCPKAVFIAPNFSKYVAASQEIREIFHKYTDVIEPLSLDEAYLDVTGHELYASKIATLIQKEIFAQTKLTGSAGVAPNKLLAKIASDMKKPNGITVILPKQAEKFMEALPLRKIHGIGPVTEKRLASVGLHLCRDVWPLSLRDLETKVGNMAQWLYNGSRGIDERPVITQWVRKSLSCEETFNKDILDLEEIKTELKAIVEKVSLKLKNKDLKGRTVVLKVRYDDFTRSTRSHTLPQATNHAPTIEETSFHLLQATEAGHRKIRLLGVGLANFI